MSSIVDKKLPWYESMKNKFLSLLLLCSTLVLLAGFSFSPVWAADAEHDDTFWQALTHTQYIQEGEMGPVVYLFLDPNCPYCHELYTWLQNPVAKNEIRLRIVVVGFLVPENSQAKAAAILGAKDPRAALQKNEEDFAIVHGEPMGGIAPAAPALVQKESGILQRNYAFLWGKESLLPNVPPGDVTVPLLVYRYQQQVRYLPTLPDQQQWQEILHGDH